MPRYFPSSWVFLSFEYLSLEHLYLVITCWRSPWSVWCVCREILVIIIYYYDNWPPNRILNEDDKYLIKITWAENILHIHLQSPFVYHLPFGFIFRLFINLSNALCLNPFRVPCLPPLWARRGRKGVRRRQTQQRTPHGIPTPSNANNFRIYSWDARMKRQSNTNNSLNAFKIRSWQT